MTDEDLRTQLAKADPCPPTQPVDGAGSPRAQNLLEDVMSTPIDHPAAEHPTGQPSTNAHRSRRWAAVLAGAAGVAVAAALVANASLGNSPELPPLALAMPAADSLGSCVVFDASLLAAVPVAFSGTVKDMTDDGVVLDVDRWYASDAGEPSQVELSIADGPNSAALDGVDFTTGQRYLVSATGGVVNGCGFSGPATAEYEAQFTAAFAN